MRYKIALAILLISIILICDLYKSSISADYEVSHIKIVQVTGVINNVTAKYIERNIEQSSPENNQLIIITLDTPGGSLEATRQIVEVILSSKIPIVS
ncbi:uncharacterized protein METZ01_LOCUS295674, partial [marine metagenome]